MKNALTETLTRDRVFYKNQSISEAITQITKSKIKILFVVDKKNKLKTKISKSVYMFTTSSVSKKYLKSDCFVKAGAVAGTTIS